jgi:hypothetical protein
MANDSNLPLQVSQTRSDLADLAPAVGNVRPFAKRLSRDESEHRGYRVAEKGARPP